jgi:hypothetical protein
MLQLVQFGRRDSIGSIAYRMAAKHSLEGALKTVYLPESSCLPMRDARKADPCV